MVIHSNQTIGSDIKAIQVLTIVRLSLCCIFTVFDSHSIREDGNISVPSTAVLLKLDTLHLLENI